MSGQEYTPLAHSCQGEFPIRDENVIDLPSGLARLPLSSLVK
jgi:hypothetical protein